VERFDRSCPANIIIPTSTAQLLRERAAERWGPSAADGRDWVLVWPSGPAADARPIGAFAVTWAAPVGCESTISQLVWDGRRACADDVRRAINLLAGWPVAWREAAPAA
jgi:hypothetical protein